jgi:hypothetical protein
VYVFNKGKEEEEEEEEKRSVVVVYIRKIDARTRSTQYNRMLQCSIMYNYNFRPCRPFIRNKSKLSRKRINNIYYFSNKLKDLVDILACLCI